MGLFLLLDEFGAQVPPPQDKLYIKTEDGFRFLTEDNYNILLENSQEQEEV